MKIFKRKLTYASVAKLPWSNWEGALVEQVFDMYYFCFLLNEIAYWKASKVLRWSLDDLQLNPDGRLVGTDEIHQICPQFTEIDVEPNGKAANVRISHLGSKFSRIWSNKPIQGCNILCMKTIGQYGNSWYLSYICWSLRYRYQRIITNQNCALHVIGVKELDSSP